MNTRIMRRILTSNTGEELSSKALDLAVGKRDEAVALKEVKDALTEKIHDDADVAAVVKAVPKVDASISVLIIIGLEGGENPQFDPGGISVFLHRSDDLDRNEFVVPSVTGLDDLSKSALSKEPNDLI